MNETECLWYVTARLYKGHRQPLRTWRFVVMARNREEAIGLIKGEIAVGQERFDQVPVIDGAKLARDGYPETLKGLAFEARQANRIITVDLSYE